MKMRCVVLEIVPAKRMKMNREHINVPLSMGAMRSTKPCWCTAIPIVCVLLPAHDLRR